MEQNSDQVKIIYQRPRMPNSVSLFVSLSIILLAFFILLNALSSYDDVRSKKAIDSIEIQFLGIFEKTKEYMKLFDEPSQMQVAKSSQNSPGDDLLFRMLNEHYDDYSSLGRFAQDYGLGGILGLIVTPRGLVITVGEDLTFGPGSSVLTTTGQEFLNRLIRIVAPFRNEILIEGHTDGLVPEGGDISNWRLSQDRAISVLRYMAANGISMRRLSAAGAGQYRPIADNTTPENMRLNRRVEIIIKHPNLETDESR